MMNDHNSEEAWQLHRVFNNLRREAIREGQNMANVPSNPNPNPSVPQVPNNPTPSAPNLPNTPHSPEPAPSQTPSAPPPEKG